MGPAARGGGLCCDDCAHAAAGLHLTARRAGGQGHGWCQTHSLDGRGLANPRTRKWGALLAFVTFLGVWPANIQAALDGGMKDLDPPMDSAAVAWIRVPFQLPMIWLAWKVYRAESARP